MAYDPFNLSELAVGKAIVKRLWLKIMNNFADHEERINNFEAGAIKIPVFDFRIKNNTLTPDSEGICYFQARQAFTITECYIQIFEQDGMGGFLEVDIQKAPDLDPLSFSSIFDTKPKINCATASDFDKSINQVFNAGQAIAAGEYLRLDLSQVPPNKIIEQFLINCYGEI